MTCRKNGPLVVLSAWTLGPLFAAALLVGCASTTAVHLQSEPEGATVTETIRGFLGQTDTTVEMKTDKKSERDFLFQLDGFEDTRIKRSISGDQMTLHARLRRLATRVRVETRPAQARVRAFHDEHEVDWSGLRPHDGLIAMDDEAIWRENQSANFVFTAEAHGYAPTRMERLLERGRSYDLRLVLEELSAEIRIDSDPSGADVYERALGYLGRTPLSVELSASQLGRVSSRRDAREHTDAVLHLRVELAGHQKAELSQPISMGGDPNKIIFNLEKQK